MINEYVELFEFAQTNSQLLKNNTTVSKYVAALLNNQEIDLKTAEDY